MSRGLAHHIIHQLDKAGHKAYMVGGCVRDTLLKRTPKDWDVCTSARPEVIQSIWPDAALIGAKFGVCLIRRDQEQVEVATFRSEGAYSDGRRPDLVKFETDVKLDVKRRDFTINALLMNSEDKVIDLVNGMKDMRNGLIRTVGSPTDRFGEDYLRMMRAVRFASRLRFRMVQNVSEAIQTLHFKLADIAPERVAQEFNAMLLQAPLLAVVHLLDTGLMLEILPSFYALRGCEQPPQYHPEGDVATHVLNMLNGHVLYCCNRQQEPSLAVLLSVILHDIGKPQSQIFEDNRIKFPGHEEHSSRIAQTFLSAYRYSNEMVERVVFLVENHMRIGRFVEMKRSKQMRLMQSPHFKDLLELHRLDCYHSNHDMTSYIAANQAYTDTPIEEIRPTRLLSGWEVMARFNLKPGPVVGQLVRHLAELQLNGDVTTRRQALEAVKEHYQTLQA